MKQYLNYAIVGVICILVGRYVLQPKQQVKEVVKVVEVEKKVKEEKKKVQTKIKEIVKKDGTKETVTVITEDSSNKETGSKESTLEKKLVSKSGKGVTIGVLALKNLDYFSDKPEFGILTAIPVLGNVSIVGTADTTKRVGLGLALEF
jgi:hypothetical protein